MTAPSMNVHMLLGSVLGESTLRFTQKGTATLNFRLETGRPQPDGRVFHDRHRVVAWGKTAEDHQGLKEGDLVQVTGRVGTRSYTDREGVKKWITETTVDRMVIFGAGGAAQAQAQAPSAPRQPPAPPVSAADPYEDDVPF